MQSNRYLLAIPAFNEDRFVTRLVREAKEYIPDVLVVDDGSTDDTAALLHDISNISVIRHHTNLGYGRSLTDAFDFSIACGYDWLITMDCDEQHQPSAIPEFTAAADKDDADIISGSRYLVSSDGPGNAPADRQMINRWITVLLNHKLGLHLTDAFCGFKAYRTDGLRRLRITEAGYAMPLQFWVQAVRAGLRVTELPVKLIYNDPMRKFGGGLDDPAVRFAHYRTVLESELASREPISVFDASPVCQAC